MRFGFVLPGGSPRELVDLAVVAEGAGWDGVFVWESGYAVDPWTTLGAMAERTSTVRLGTMLTPLPWRRPWKVAAQAATLDHLSGGRAVLTVATGAADPVLGRYGETTDRHERAERLDEGIDLIAALWAGERAYAGRHYDVEVGTYSADLRCVQSPRVPIWVVGAWPRPKSMGRALRADGLVPICLDDDGLRPTTPDDVRAMIAWLDDHGGRRPGFDVITEGETPAADPAAASAAVAPWAEAGCTWWIESRWQAPEDGSDPKQAVTARLEAGPPRL
ncbi:MAG TPA: LLM class flavin-dependent oxidoreductase [Acidimicrobiales bacterium]|nr:LLM class flavin-dependent oxidoreductase [Acidimicrobiales bacterium]